MLPRSRSERHELRHKDALEKARLRNRSGGYYRCDDVSNPIEVQKGCPSHLDGGKTRMVAGPRVVESLFAEREASKVARDNDSEGRRARNYSREEERWRSIASKERLEQERLDRLQKDPLLGRKNVKGQPFDIVHHGYDSTPEGHKLMHHDNMIKYRGRVREANIAMRNHMGFNPIIGEQTVPITLPPIPRPPPLALA